MTREFKFHVKAVLFLTIVTGLIYAQCIGHEFLNWDDAQYVVDNRAIQGFSWENLQAMFTQYYVCNYAPLHILSYSFDYLFWGLWPGGYLFSNILLHLANGLLLYLLVWRLAGTKWAAVTAAALFLFHPLQVESVAWISQRKNVLAMFFFLLSLLFYLKYRCDPQGSKSALVLSVLAFAAATLSKSVAIILPVVLVLLDQYLSEKSGKRITLLDKLPYLLVAILCGVVALESQSLHNDLLSGRRDYLSGSGLVTLQTMLPVFARYLALIIWPEGLSAIYSPEIREHLDPQVILAGILFMLFLAAGALLFRRNRLIFFWWGLFLAGFIPVSQIVPIITLMNDRYCYFPMLGVAGACGTFCAGFFAGRDRPGKKLVTCGGIALLLILGFFSWQRAKVWKDSVTLWTATYRAGDHAYGYDSQFVQTTLANSYFKRAKQKEQQGELRPAAADYLAAVEMAPDNYEVLNGAGVHFTQNGKLLLGQRYLLRLTALYPKKSEGWLNLGFNYLMTREFDKAAVAARISLGLRPEAGKPRLLLGHVAMGTGKTDEAQKEYLAAEASGERSPDLAYNLACLHARSGRLQEALARLEQAVSWGYDNFEHMRSDADLENLRNMPEFKRLLDLQKGQGPNIRKKAD